MQSMIEARQTVKHAARRRPFGEGLLPPEPAVSVHAVRRMLLGIGVTNYERMLMADAFDKAIWAKAHCTKDAKAVELYGSEEALKALQASRKPAPVVEETPLPRSRRFEPSEAEWEAANALFRGDTNGQEYAEWVDQTDREWDAACPAEVLSEACELRGPFVGHPA